MKKNLMKWLVVIMCVMPMHALAGDNTIKFTPGFKVGTGIGAFLLDVEYERKIMPLTSAYIKYGTSSFDIDTTQTVSGVSVDSTVSIDFTNFAFGARYDLWLLYVGLGYEATSMDLSDSATGGSASGSINGPVVEIGKAFSIGPISFGAGVGLQFATINIDYSGTEFDLGSLPSSGSLTLARFQTELGFNF